MKQWSLRVSAYAERLLKVLKILNGASRWSNQRNWIGYSKGAVVYFDIVGHDHSLRFLQLVPTLFSVQHLWF